MGTGSTIKFLLCWSLFLGSVLWAADGGTLSENSEKRCNTSLRIISSAVITPLKIAVTLSKEIGHTLYFPYVKAAQALREGWGIYRSEPGRSWSELGARIWKKDKWRAGIFSALLALNHQTTVNFREFELATRSFEEANPKGQVIVVDAFSEEDWLYPKAGRYMHRNKYKNTETALLEPETNKSTHISIESLMDLVRKKGRIAKLDIFGHGLPGEAPGPRFSTKALGNSADGKTELRPDDVFAPGAQVRFNSCFVGNGPKGREFLAEFEETFLANGGTVYASELQMTANPLEYSVLKLDIPEPPGLLRDLAQPARTPLGLWTSAVVGFKSSEGKMEFPVINRILIHRVLPKEKAWSAPELTVGLEEIHSDLSAFEDMYYMTNAYQERYVLDLLNLPDPRDSSKKFGSASDWKIHLRGYPNGILGEFEIGESDNFIKAFNSANIPGLKIQELPISSYYTKPRILLQLVKQTNLVLMKTLLEVRSKTENYLESLGTPGSTRELEWLQKANEDAKLRHKQGHLTEAEVELATSQASRKLDYLRGKTRRMIIDINDRLKDRQAVQ